MNNSVFTDTKRSVRKYDRGNDYYEKDEVVIEKDARCCPRPRPVCCPKKVDPCDPCARRGGWWWVWSFIVVFIVLGIGLWIIKPYWVLRGGDLANRDLLPGGFGFIDWSKLLIWDLVITLILLFIAWIIKVIAGDGYGYGGWY